MTTEELKAVANEMRKDVIRMVYQTKEGHLAGSLSGAEIFAGLYFGGGVKIFPKDPRNEERDRVVVSNGHVCPIWYSALARAGFFPTEELKTLQQLGSRLQGHPHYRSIAGVENTSGSLDQGLSQAAGMAKAAKIDGKNWRVYCVISDTELEGGQTWEAMGFAVQHKLDNLTLFIDRNGIQVSGKTEEVMGVEMVEEKLKGWRWEALTIDGNNIEEVVKAIEKAKTIKEKPTVIIAKTTAGKGVSFMEGKFEWHGRGITKEEAEKALQELGEGELW